VNSARAATAAKNKDTPSTIAALWQRTRWRRGAAELCLFDAARIVVGTLRTFPSIELARGCSGETLGQRIVTPAACGYHAVGEDYGEDRGPAGGILSAGPILTRASARTGFCVGCANGACSSSRGRRPRSRSQNISLG